MTAAAVMNGRKSDPPPGRMLSPPSTILQLCAPVVRLHPVSLGSKPSLTGRESCSPSLCLSMVSHKHKPPMLGLAFLKCQKNCPKAFRPVKLSQTCKTEPLMKYINLEHWAPIQSNVLFAYKPPRGKQRECACVCMCVCLGWGCILDKHVIEEESLQTLGGWNTLIRCSIFFNHRKDETLRPTSPIRLTKQEEGGESTELSLDRICLADTAQVPTDCCVKMSNCVSSLFEKALKMHLSSHAFEMIRCCRTHAGIWVQTNTEICQRWI